MNKLKAHSLLCSHKIQGLAEQVERTVNNDVLVHVLQLDASETEESTMQKIAAKLGYYFTEEQLKASRTMGARSALRKEIPKEELELP